MNKPSPFATHLTSLLRRLVTGFIFHPADLEIRAAEFSQILDFEWRANRADVSRIIGECGANYEALRDLVVLIGLHNGYDVSLPFLLPATKGRPERYEPYLARRDWPRREIMELLHEAAVASTRHKLIEIVTEELATDKTAVRVAIATEETLDTETVLRRTLNHLFGVIGFKNGHQIAVNVVRELETEAQPERADGRFAPVKRTNNPRTL